MASHENLHKRSTSAENKVTSFHENCDYQSVTYWTHHVIFRHESERLCVAISSPTPPLKGTSPSAEVRAGVPAFCALRPSDYWEFNFQRLGVSHQQALSHSTYAASSTEMLNIPDLECPRNDSKIRGWSQNMDCEPRCHCSAALGARSVSVDWSDGRDSPI